MKGPTIRLDEWLTELRRLERESRDRGEVVGFSCNDLSVRLGINPNTARDWVRRWFLAGLVEVAGRKPVTAMDGRNSWSPVYRMRKVERRASRLRSTKRR